MTSVPAAISKAIAQLGDPKILRVLVKTVFLTLLIFVAAGFGLIFGLNKAAAGFQTGFEGEIITVLAVLATIVGAWLLFRIVALAVLQFFADEVVQAVEAKHFADQAKHVRSLGWREELAQSGRSIVRALGVNALALIVAIPLFFTAIGPAIVFWIANGWLLGRELQDMVWLRHRKSADDPPPLSKIERFFLGGIVTALLAIPFINLLAPIIGAASATHLVHGRLARAKARSGNEYDH